MLDILNERLVAKGEDPIAFDHDCREGICGMCALMIDGQAHGPDKAATTCQLHMRHFQGRRRSYHRALAREGLPGRQGPGRGPLRLRPHPGRRRLRLGQHRQRPGRQRDPDPQGERREGDGRRRLHRLRRLRGRLPERLGDALRRGQGLPVRSLAPGPARAREARARHARPDGREGFGNCTNSTSARRPNPSSSIISRMASTASRARALGQEGVLADLAATNSIAEAFGQAATQAPQPMQEAASMAFSAWNGQSGSRWRPWRCRC